MTEHYGRMEGNHETTDTIEVRTLWVTRSPLSTFGSVYSPKHTPRKTNFRRRPNRFPAATYAKHLITTLDVLIRSTNKCRFFPLKYDSKEHII